MLKEKSKQGKLAVRSQRSIESVSFLFERAALSSSSLFKSVTKHFYFADCYPWKCWAQNNNIPGEMIDDWSSLWSCKDKWMIFIPGQDGKPFLFEEIKMGLSKIGGDRKWPVERYSFILKYSWRNIITIMQIRNQHLLLKC